MMKRWRNLFRAWLAQNKFCYSIGKFIPSSALQN